MDNPNSDNPSKECSELQMNEDTVSELDAFENVGEIIEEILPFQNAGITSLVNHKNIDSPIIESSTTPSLVPLFDILCSGQDPINSPTRNKNTLVYQEGSVDIEHHEEFSIEDIFGNNSTQKSSPPLTPVESPIFEIHPDCDIFKMKQSILNMSDKKIGRKSNGNLEKCKEIHLKTVSRRSARLLSPISQKQVPKHEHLNGLDKKQLNDINGEIKSTKIPVTNESTIFSDMIYTRSSKKAITELNDKIKNVHDSQKFIPKMNKTFPPDKIHTQGTNSRKKQSLYNSSIPVINKMKERNGYEKINGLGKNVPLPPVTPSKQTVAITELEEENLMIEINSPPIDNLPNIDENISNDLNENASLKMNGVLESQQSPKKRGRGRPRKVNTPLELAKEIVEESRNTDSLVASNIQTSETQIHSILDLNTSFDNKTVTDSKENCELSNEKPLRKSDRLKTKTTPGTPTSINLNQSQHDYNDHASPQKSFRNRSSRTSKPTYEKDTTSIILSVEEESKDESKTSETQKEINENISDSKSESPTKKKSQNTKNISKITENFAFVEIHQNKSPKKKLKHNKENMDKRNSIEPILYDKVLSSELTISVHMNEVSPEKHECDTVLSNETKFDKEAEITSDIESYIETKTICETKLFEDDKIFNTALQTNGASMKGIVKHTNLKEKCLKGEKIEINESFKEEKLLESDLNGICLMSDVFTTKDEKYVSKINTENESLKDSLLNSKPEDIMKNKNKDTGKIKCLDNNSKKVNTRIKERKHLNDESTRKSSSVIEEENVSDFGYKTQRRSFRILLEQVKKISIIEAEETTRRALRLQRCKSVPHEDISFKNGAAMHSSNQNLKHINGDSNHISNDDLQPIRRERAKSLYISKLASPTKKTMVTKPESVSPVSKDTSKTSGKENAEQTSPDRVKKTPQSPGSKKKDANNKTTLKTPENQDKTSESHQKFIPHQKETTISAEQKSLSTSIVDEADLEVQRELKDFSPEKLQPIKRTRSYSQGSELRKNDKFSFASRSKSVIGRPKKKLKTLRHVNLLTDSFQTINFEGNRKEIAELEVGDLIWGKLGNYPYWPCLIVSDPETSEFKKFKLLRSLPYFHVRFFGDKGKRAWTAHVIHYKEPNDLNNFAEEYRRQGVSASTIREDFVIRKSQRKKWDRGVAEAELLKNESLEKKLNFFNEILTNASSNASVSSQASESSDENSCSSRDRIRGSKRIKKNETISLRESLLISSINDVVTKYTSWDSEDSSDDSIYQEKTVQKQKRKSNSPPTKNIPDSSLGFELLDIPSLDIDAASTSVPESDKSEITKPYERKGREQLEQSFIKTSPSLRTRSKSRPRIEHQRNQLKTPSNLEIPSPKLPSTPPEIEKKQADQFDSESGISDLSLSCSSTIPQLKKNLFRGVPREKVCQICEKPGRVVKCKGQCYGDYHIDCVEKSFNLTNEQDDDTNEELDLNDQVQIITVASRKKMSTLKLSLSPSNRKMTLTEQIDRKMKEVMKHVEAQNTESTDSSGEDVNPYEKIEDKVSSKNSSASKSRHTFKHVTADDISIIRVKNDAKEKPSVSNETPTNSESYKCSYCVSSVLPPCFVCKKVISLKGIGVRQRCSFQKCGRFYHLGCLKEWRQTQWSFMLHENKKSEAFDSFVCPRHVCHTCSAENTVFSKGTCSSDKVVKCLQCPATYHNSHLCIPAGTQLLTSAQVICPRHTIEKKKITTCNAIWCFVCAQGGNLICCETCPTSVHVECLPVNLLDDNTYICEDCECGRFPLYDELVWVKCGTFRWWPARILFPSEVPSNIQSKPHKKGEFVVKFFGTYDFLWTGRGRTFLYIEGDTGNTYSKQGRINTAFSRALQEVADADLSNRGSKSKREAVDKRHKPPPYVRIKINRPVGNVKVFEGNLSNTTSCDCDPNDSNPCGPNSNCLNRILLTECNPEVCPAGQECRNRCFDKREYPQVIPYRTSFRGWGLKTLEPIKKGQFVIEYVGEIIDDDEYERRIDRMHQQKDENYYFLTIDRDRMLDAGPKGNAARFMNHSCQPNCETQKWTVNGDTRVGLFAIDDIPADTELTFNYNLECVGTEKKICKCGASNCSGYIGVKPDDQTSIKRYKKKKKSSKERQKLVETDPCLICGEQGETLKCSNKLCLKSYHFKCVQLDYRTETEDPPKGKWTCPSHTCNICSRRTMRSCVQCLNSYCPAHSEGNVRHDEILGYLCSKHDFTEQAGPSGIRFIKGDPNLSTIDDSSVTDVSYSASTRSSRSERYKKRRGSNMSIEPSPKKRKLNSV